MFVDFSGKNKLFYLSVASDENPFLIESKLLVLLVG